MWKQEFNSAKFITDEKRKDEIGCVYICQGYYLNFAGIILGPDIYYDMQNKTIKIDISKCYDKKAINKNDIHDTERYILNQYLVLLIRGILGTYIHAVDKNLRDYFKTCILTKEKNKK